jgi:hypothetical protein
MRSISEFRNIHKGETMLLVGNGENLRLTPPEWFDYRSIGMNTIHKYTDYVPNYYTTVDTRVYSEYGAEIAKKYAGIPKFIPYPRLKMWKGANFYHLKSQEGPLWPMNRLALWQENIDNAIITYSNITHVALKLVYYMGASTILIIGMEHKPHFGDRHFWGIDIGMSAGVDLKTWFNGYKLLCGELAKRNVRVLNISENTYVPGEIIPRGNWKDFTTPHLQHGATTKEKPCLKLTAIPS